MPKVIEENMREFSDPNSDETAIREYVRLKETMSHMESRTKELRDKLMARLDENGVEDESGNLVWSFPTIDGVHSLVKTRRTSRKLNEARAEEIAAEHGLEEVVYKTIRVLDEDALMAQYYEGTLNENELDQMFPIQVTWALNTKK